MTKRADSHSGVVVYGDLWGSLVFIPKARAVESSTWGELRQHMPAEEYENVLEMTGGDRTDFDEFLREERETRPELTNEDARKEYLALSPDLRAPETDDLFPRW
jgi:hypothetical protein